MIFQDAAKRRYYDDYTTLSRAELSQEDFWTERPPLAPATLPDLTDRSAGIFRTQRDQINGPLKPVWVKYWKQVESFNPAKLITVPIRISQADGDERVKPEKTRLLLEQLETIDGIAPITVKFYLAGAVPEPVPPGLGEHFGLLVDPREIRAIIAWFAELQTGQR